MASCYFASIVTHKKTWSTGAAQVHVKPPSTHLIKSKHSDNLDNDFVRIKLRGDTIPEKSFNMDLFENDKPEEFLLFVHNFNTTLAASGTLTTEAKVQYLHLIVHVKALLQFYALYDDKECTNPLTAETIILRLALYLFPVNLISKQKCVMRHITKKLRGLKSIQYADRLIDLNYFLDMFPGVKLSQKLA